MFVLASASQSSAQIDGFTEPFRSIELASDESGSIAKLDVVEGQSLKQDDIIACLDKRVQEIQVEIAKQLASNSSQIFAAEQSYRKRLAIYNKLQKLTESGHASNSEIIRAEMELSIAKAKYLSAQEEKAVRETEVKRAEIQLERRIIRAPFDGVVSTIHRKQGEFLSPLKPEIITLIQNDQLLANFAVPSTMVSQLTVGKQLDVEFMSGKVVKGIVHSIGVVTDAQSGTIQVKVLIDNTAGKLRAGENCSVRI